MLVLPKAPRKNLTTEQEKAFETMRTLLQDITEADRRYDQLEQSYAGRIISTDIARYLDARYSKGKRSSKRRA